MYGGSRLQLTELMQRCAEIAGKPCFSGRSLVRRFSARRGPHVLMDHGDAIHELV